MTALFPRILSSTAILFPAILCPPAVDERGRRPALMPTTVTSAPGDIRLTATTEMSAHGASTSLDDRRNTTARPDETARYHPVTNQSVPLVAPPTEGAGGPVGIRAQALPRHHNAHPSVVLPVILTTGMMVALMRRRPRSKGGNPLGQIRTELRLAADVGAARFLDQALRLLAAELTAAGRTLPSVYAATVSDNELVLHLAPAEPDGPPPPWQTGRTPGTWRIERTTSTVDGLLVDDSRRIPVDTPAPYPGLAVMGTDDRGARVLVDVEAAPGIISLGGDAALAREAAVSIAVELATNPWSNDLRVYMTGFSGRLVPIAPDRLRSSTSLGDVLDELESRRSRRGRVAGGEPRNGGSLGPVLRGRPAARHQALWAPELLILAAPPSERETARLSALLRDPSQGVGVVTFGDSTAARWRFTVSPNRRLHLGVLGLEISAQTLSTREYPTIVRMLRKAGTAYALSGRERSTSRTAETETTGSGPDHPHPAYPSPQRISSPDAQSPRRPGPGPGNGTAQVEDRRRGSEDAAVITAFPDESRPASTSNPAQEPTPWVPEIPLWMRPEASTVESESLPHNHPPIPPVPSVPPPSAPPRTPPVWTPSPPPRTPPPAIAPPVGRPPKPPPPPSEPPLRLTTEHPDSINPAGRVHSPSPSVDTSSRGGDSRGGDGASVWRNRAMPAWDLQVSGASGMAMEPVPPRAPGARSVQPYPFPPSTAFPAEASHLPSTPPPGELWPPPPPLAPAPAPRKTTGLLVQLSGRTAAGETLMGEASDDGGLPQTDPPGDRALSTLPAPLPQPVPQPVSQPPTALPVLLPATLASPLALPVPVTPPAEPGELFRSTDVEIRIMGEITVEAPGPCDPDRREFLTELVVYLALHRSGVLSSALSAVLLPPETPDNVLSNELDHVAGWLGTNNEGLPHITVSDNGCWSLADGVRCDWDLFVAYAHHSAQPESDSENDLTTALRLVTGPLWANLPAGRYRWLDSSRIRTITSTAVVDVAHRLANITLSNGDTATAIAACRTGLRAAPTAEVLWRDLLRTVAARHDRKALEAVINEMYQMIAPQRTDLGIQAETNTLVRELLPGFRRRQQSSSRRSAITGR